MSPWRQLRRGLRALTNRRATDSEHADEVDHYVEQATAAYMARGMSETDAARAARMEIGGSTQAREQMRAYGWENVVDSTWSDVRHAVRRLRAAPGFTLMAVLTLSLGIGATTAIFSAVNPILFEPLPYPDSKRIAMIWEIASDGERSEGTFGMYRELAVRSRAFETIAVLRPWQPTMTGFDQPERLNGQRVSASYFAVLGVSPRMGRAFTASDDRGDGPNVAVISDGLWRRRFSADSTIIGRAVSLDGNAFVILGVMPNGFENVLAPDAEIWAPLQYDMAQGRAWGHHLRTVGRLRPGVNVDQATRELTAIGTQVLAELRPETYDPKTGFRAVPLRSDVARNVKPALVAVLCAVALVLVIACVNVTNLLLVRGVRRRAEFALRAALGARQSRLIRQLLTESIVLSALGGVCGMGIAILGVRTLIAVSPPGLPRVAAIGVSGTMFAFGVAVTTLIGVAFGLAPALHAARSSPNVELQQGSRRATGGHRRVRSALVVAEVALALVLLVGSGLLLRSLERLFAVDAGFDASQLLTMQVQTAGPRYREDSTTYRFFFQALAAVRQVPGVTAAALSSQLPLSGDADLFGLKFHPSTINNSGELRGTFRYAVSPGYFETMRIPLKRGRFLDDRDMAQTERVAVISESIARRRLAGLDPIGHRVSIGPPTPLYTIVGVVGDVRQMSLAENEADAVYVTPAQWHFADNVMSLIVRSRDDAAVLVPYLREAIWSVDKDQPIVRVATMQELVDASGASRRFALMLFEVFAFAALILAAAGIYGVLSGSVAERTREIGARAALGGSRSHILRLVLRQGMALAFVGIVLGIALSGAATQGLVSLLFAVSPLDAVTYAAVIALLLVVSLVACLVPAWRAARVDPAIVLRAD
ncbi:MAG TPA: ABC transporter permease [Gemmatimonadaceae bacterium]|nr:ABC transporter permease [Gemmatimonadaceae bacterium]